VSKMDNVENNLINKYIYKKRAHEVIDGHCNRNPVTRQW
jgi:hypothetical protein